jgi:hypothetical protein
MLPTELVFGQLASAPAYFARMSELHPPGRLQCARVSLNFRTDYLSIEIDQRMYVSTLGCAIFTVLSRRFP